MECHTTTSNLKIDKNKSIGEVIIIVEGESDEFSILKHIFTNILDYNYIPIKRNKCELDRYQSKSKKNSVVTVLNTSSSSIKTMLEDLEYEERIFDFIKQKCGRVPRYARTYILWDRDYNTNDKEVVERALNTFSNSLENPGYGMNGILLLSYPCLECFYNSNFDKQFYRKSFCTSDEAKKSWKMSKYSISNINERTLLLAVCNMHQIFKGYNIFNYDPSDFAYYNKRIYYKQEDEFEINHCYKALSLIAFMLIDLDLIQVK